MLQHKVLLEKHLVEPGNVPALALYKNDGKKKPLIITVHGYTGNKSGEIDYCLVLAEQGFLPVSIDARLHGERAAPDFEERMATNFPKEMLGAMIGTAKDISLVIDYFVQRSDVLPDKIGVMGISMGACIAYLATTLDERIEASVPIIGSPSWDFTLMPQDPAQFGAWPEPDEELMTLITSYNPHDRIEHFFPKALLMLNGVQDEMVPVDGARQLYETLQPLYQMQPERLSFIAYEGVGHEFTAEMSHEVVNWFKRFLD
ncbi:MAG: prolyl oligopeptidase family serine peptidase [Chloroflexota bacterium]|nr:prolyl oligopeptidase family serine peptidase [Chloroflexota bacterium]